MPEKPIERLTRLIAEGKVTAIIGTGVSIAATKNAPAASWTGLIGLGVDYIKDRIAGLAAGWEDRIRGEISSPDLGELLSAAEKISEKLGAPNGGDFRNWLRETVGQLKLADDTVLKALADLNIPLATTNYDSLIEQATTLSHATWRDGNKVSRVLRGEDRAVLHLHGYWEEPESVVLGIRSYDRILGDSSAQAALRALMATRTLLFIGYGAGLRDPNFGKLLQWVREVYGDAEHTNFRICRTSEVDELRKQHTREERIDVLGFGPDHKDLAAFLRNLTRGIALSKVPTNVPAAITTIARPLPLPALKICIGRDDQREDLAANLLLDAPLPVPVMGAPGIGKSTLVTAVLHDPRIAKRYGDRRFFVRCDGINTAGALASEIGLAMGIPPSGNIEQDAIFSLMASPAALTLDNLETPWEADREPVEELLAKLARIPAIALIVTIRGQERPLNVAWRDDALRLQPLSSAAARSVFLNIAGKKFENDPNLANLIGVADGLPLAITLLAAAAEGEPNLAETWRR